QAPAAPAPNPPDPPAPAPPAAPAPRPPADTPDTPPRAADVRDVVVGGARIVRDHGHTRVPDPAAALAAAVSALRG
ncbi:formimidoylglutamate deiminase, partial [Streptomyces sp. NPDC047970]